MELLFLVYDGISVDLVFFSFFVFDYVVGELGVVDIVFVVLVDILVVRSGLVFFGLLEIYF